MALWIIAGAFSVAAAPFIAIAQRIFARDRVIARWPRAPGVITAATVEARSARRRDEDGYDHEYTAYQPIVRYTYTVDGREFVGDRIGRVAFTTDLSSARECCNRYPPQRHVEVLYDPNDPATAYLEIKRSIGAVILFVWGCVFLLVAAILALLALIL